MDGLDKLTKIADVGLVCLSYLNTWLFGSGFVVAIEGQHGNFDLTSNDGGTP